MDGYKSIFTSTVFWGAVAGLVVAMFAVFKIDLDIGEVQKTLEALGAIISFGIIIYGRVKATKKIGTAPEKKKVKGLAKFVVLPLILSLAAMPGCATLPDGTDTEPEETAYKVLLSARLTYEATMPALGEAYQSGLITEDQKDKIVDYANKYLGAYRAAVVALAEYVKLKNTDAEARLAQALVDMNGLFAEFLALVTPYLTSKDGV